MSEREFDKFIKRIAPLPNWVLTNRQPAFYDTESASALQQTAKIYGKMQELLVDYDKFIAEINEYIKFYQESTDRDLAMFKYKIEKKIYDFTQALEIKYTEQDLEIDKAIQYMKDNLVETIKNLNDNGELDSMIVNAISNVQENLQFQIMSLASGSPLVASSTSEMTQTDKIYVNTTDGKWYYHNGTTWVIGGTYQSTGIANNSIIPEMEVMWKRNNLVPKFNWITGKVYNISTGNLMNFTGCYNEEYVDITGITKILCKNANQSKLHIYFYDSSKNFISSTDCAQNTIVVPNDSKYVRFSIWTNEYTELPDIFTELYDMNNFIYKKPYSIKDYYQTNGKNIKYTDSDFFLTGKPYGQNDDTVNSYNDNSINYNVTTSTTVYRGFYLYGNFKVGDSIKIYNGVNSKYSLYPKNTNNYSIESIDMGNYKEIIVNQTILNNLNGENLYKITSKYDSDTQEQITVTVNDTPISLGEFIMEQLKIKREKIVNAIVLGDSITRLSGDRSWLRYFNTIQPINIIQNVAVNGATLMDKENTIYDGNPVFDGADNNENNVLGNQVQKILNNNYSAPDIIIIAIGTNAGIDTTTEDIYNTYYDNNNQKIPLSNLDRKTPEGAYRYCNETLKNKYPNAKIFWCSPIYAANISQKPLSRVNDWAKNLEQMCLCGGSQFINTMNCGITPVTEAIGENGLYLLDGLHPNSNGAKCMGEYNARAMNNWLKSI